MPPLWLIAGLATVALVLCAWLFVRGIRQAAPDDASPLLQRARVLAQEQDAKWPDRDGEAKRHQVYSRLLKEFPTRAKREIARAIEDAI